MRAPTWTEFCPQRALTRHANISTVACPYCGAANPQKAARQERQILAEAPQNEEIIDLTQSPPPDENKNNPHPSQNAATIKQEVPTHYKPPAMQAIRHSPLNRFSGISQTANDARVSAFTKKEYKSQPHAGSNTRRPRQQEKKGKESAVSSTGSHQVFVYVYECVKSSDGTVIRKWQCTGKSS